MLEHAQALRPATVLLLPTPTHLAVHKRHCCTHLLPRLLEVLCELGIDVAGEEEQRAQVVEVALALQCRRANAWG